MRVILQHNLDPAEGLVNGTQGTILDFEPYVKGNLPQKGGSGNAPAITGAHARYRQEEIRRFTEENGYQGWPIVEFDNDSGSIRTVFGECAVDEKGTKEPFSLLSRSRSP
jgi:ATP-dependent DNA helicase PIF1